MGALASSLCTSIRSLSFSFPCYEFILRERLRLLSSFFFAVIRSFRHIRFTSCIVGVYVYIYYVYICIYIYIVFLTATTS